MSRTRKTAVALAAATALAAGGVTSCGGGGDVKIGAVLPLSGQFALYGTPIKQGIELAYAEYQEDPEAPYPIDLEIVDSESDPERAKELLQRLYRDGAVAAIGGVTTSEAMAMVPVADEADNVLLSPSASNPALTGISRNFFRIFPSDFREGNKMGNFAAEGLGIDRVVILAAESPYARGVQDVFQNEFQRYGGEVTEVIEYPPGGTDFTGLVQRALQLEPVGVYVADYAQNTTKIIRELRRQDFDGKILTTSAYSAAETLAGAGEEAEGVILTQVAMMPDQPETTRFLEGYREMYDTPADIWAAHGYDAFRVLAQALVEGGRSPSDVWRGMRSIRELRGPSGLIQFDEKGDVSKFPRVYVVEDGGLVDYEEAVDEKRQEILRRIEQLNRRRARG